jgi:hypothetical protein
MDLTRPHVQALAIDDQAVMIPFNRFVESVVVDRPLLGECSGPDRGQREAGDSHRCGLNEQTGER